MQPDPGLDGGLDLVVERLDRVPHRRRAEDRAGHGLRPDDLLQRGAGLLAQPVQIRRTARVDRVVDQHGRGDLTAQRVTDEVLRELLAQRGREVRVQQGAQVRVVGQRGVQQLLGDRDLRVRHQDGRLRTGQAVVGAQAFADLAVGGQELQRAVQVPLPGQVLHEALLGVEHGAGLGEGVGDRRVLGVVVAQDQAADLVGHLGEQLVALLDCHVAVGDQGVEQDLDVHLVVGGVHARAVVDGVGVDLAAVPRELDPAELGQTEVAALADDLDAQVGAVDADDVVGLVTDVRVRLGRGLDVRTDAAVPQQVHRRLEDGLHQLGRRHLGDLALDTEGLADVRVDRDRLGGTGEDAATGRDQLGVVVLPAGARQLEDAAALGVGGGRVGLGIDEDVPVVEGGDQADVLAEQHAVAEHVTGHVADADDREVLALRVHAQLTEVPLDGLPGAAGGDAHALVVVTRAAAGGEGVTEPEVVLLGDPVGDVGEGRGALVGGDDEVGVVLVVPDDVLRRHDLAGDHVVGDVEQRRDEGLVARDPLRQPRVAVHGRVRQLLGDEAALGADRHDDGVLHHLRLDQAEDLRPEVLTPVGPAQAASRDLAEAQVHALDTRRVDPDLVRRPWRGQIGDGLRVELHGDVVVVPAARRLLEEVRAQRRLDDGEEGPQDPVLVEARHLVERRVDLFEQRVHDLPARGLAVRRHPRLEQGDEEAGGVDVVAESVLHVVLREGGAGLAQVLRVRPQHHRLPPGQPGAQHEGVEAVVLRLAGPGRGERLREPLARVVAEVVPGAARRLGHAQAEVVDPGDAAVGAAQFVRPLVHDLDAEPGEDRQNGGQGDGRALAVDLEPALLGGRADRLVQAQREVVVLGELFDVDEVGDRGARGVVGLVALGEGARVAAQQLCGALLTELGVQRVGEAVGPGAGGLDEPRLDALLVRVAELRQLGALRDPDDEVQPGEDRLGVPGGEVDAGAAELLLQDVDDPQPYARGVAVPREVDEGGVVTPVLVLPQVEPQPAAFLEVEHGGGDALQLGDRGLEELVARIGLQDLEQVAPVVTVGREAGDLQHLVHLAPDDRHPADGLGVGSRGEQAQVAPLADDLAVLVELLHPDVVEVRRPVHGRPAVGLGEDEQLVFAGLGARVGGQPLEGRADGVGVALGVVRVGTQDAEPGPRHGGQRVVLAQLVLAVAEEREVVVGQPAQQLAGLLELLLAQVGMGLLDQLVGHAHGQVPHLAPVLDGLADVGQDAQQVGGDLLQVTTVGLPVELDVDPGLGVRVVRQLTGGRRRAQLDELAGDVAADEDLRVDDHMDAAPLPGQLVGHGIDQEGHVVGDDFHDRVAAGPPVLFHGGRVHPHVGRALGAVLGQSVVREGGSEDVDRVAVAEVLRGGVQVVALEEREHGVVVRGAGAALVRRPSR